MRKIFTITVIILLTFISLTPVVSGKANWKEGKVWSYKWTYDIEENKESLENSMKMTFSEIYGGNSTITFSEISGGFAYLFYIEFQEKKDGQYIFTYEGGYYSQMKMDSDINITTGDDGLLQNKSITIQNNLNIEEMSIDFQGKLWAEQYSREYDELFGQTRELNTMGITKQTLNTTGKVNLTSRQKTQIKSNTTETETDMKTTLDTNWNLDLTLEYGKFLPWLPHLNKTYKNMPDDKNLGVKYRGNISGTYKSISDGGSYTSTSDQIFDEELDGMSSIEGTLKYNGSNKISKPSPVKNCPWLGEKILLFKSQDSNYMDMSYALKSTIGTKSVAKYNETQQFYTEYYLPQTGSTGQISCNSGVCSLPSTADDIDEIEITSESTEKNEVIAFRKDKKSYFSEQVGNIDSEDPSTYNLLQDYDYVLISILIAIVLILAYYLRVKSSDDQQKNDDLNRDDIEEDQK